MRCLALRGLVPVTCAALAACSGTAVVRGEGLADARVLAAGPGRPDTTVTVSAGGRVRIPFRRCEQSVLVVAARRGCRPEVWLRSSEDRGPLTAGPCRPLPAGRALLAGVVYGFGAGGRRCSASFIESVHADRSLELQVDDRPLRARTDANGLFEVPLDPGPHRVTLPCLPDPAAGVDHRPCSCERVVTVGPGETAFVHCGGLVALID